MFYIIINLLVKLIILLYLIKKFMYNIYNDDT